MRIINPFRRVIVFVDFLGHAGAFVRTPWGWGSVHPGYCGEHDGYGKRGES